MIADSGIRWRTYPLSWGNNNHGNPLYVHSIGVVSSWSFLISDAAEPEQIQALLMEASMLKGLNHQYIYPVIAVCLDGPPLLIYPECTKGNLKVLLKSSTDHPVRTNMATC